MAPTAGARALPSRPKHEPQRLLKVIQVARSLTSDLDLNGILQKVLEGALDVVPACNAATLHLYNPGLQKLVLYDAIGFGSELRDIALSPGQGLAGQAFKVGRPQIYRNPAKAAEGMRQ